MTTASMLLKRQLQNSAMLYHSEVICCELVVVKTRLNCHESARMRAVAAIGSIGSTFIHCHGGEPAATVSCSLGARACLHVTEPLSN